MRNIVLYKMLIFVVISSFLTVYRHLQNKYARIAKPYIAFKYKHLSALFGNSNFIFP